MITAQINCGSSSFSNASVVMNGLSDSNHASDGDESGWSKYFIDCDRFK